MLVRKPPIASSSLGSLSEYNNPANSLVKQQDYEQVRDVIRAFVSNAEDKEVIPHLEKLLELSTPTPDQLTQYRSGVNRSLDTFLVNGMESRNMVDIMVNSLAYRISTSVNNKLVLSIGLEIVRNLSRSERCQTSIARNSNFVAWLLKAGRDVNLEERCQYLLFGILNNVVSDPDLATSLFAQHRHVVDVLLECIRDTKRQAQNREWAMAAISNLANAGPIRVPLATTPLLVQTLIEHGARSPSDTMSEWALLAMLGLTAADANHYALQSNNELVELFLNVIDPHAKFSLGCRDLAMSCVANLCRSAQARRRFGAITKLFDYLFVTVEKEEEMDLRENAVRTLCVMASSPDLAKRIGREREMINSLLGIWRGQLPAYSTMETTIGTLFDAIDWPCERVQFVHASVVLLAVRFFPHVGLRSTIRVLPFELIRKVVESTGWRTTTT